VELIQGRRSSLLFDSLEAANTAWKEKKAEVGDKQLMVACGNRLDRCWELPRFSPLYKDYDPRQRQEQVQGQEHPQESIA
jgi:hypothetical protein